MRNYLRAKISMDAQDKHTLLDEVNDDWTIEHQWIFDVLAIVKKSKFKPCQYNIG